MANFIVGLDIGHSSVKGVKLVAQKKGADLVAFAKHSLNKEVVERGKVIDEGILATVLEEVAKEIRPMRSAVVTAISAEQAVVRTLKLPKMTEKELKETIPWEIEQYLSYPATEAAIDYVIMGKKNPTEDDDGMLDVLVVAAPKVIVDSYLRPLRAVGINPVCLDLQPYALVHNYLYFNNDNTKNIALIDMGASTTDIVILEKDEVILTRTISLGGDDFTKTIADTKNIYFQDAEEEKLKMAEEDGLDDCLVPLAEEFVQEITRSLGYFQIQRRGQAVDGILLTGGCIGLAGFKEFLREKISVDLQLWEIPSSMGISQNILFAHKNLQSNIMVSLGLALSEVMV